jgi:hypothetical protein
MALIDCCSIGWAHSSMLQLKYSTLLQYYCRGLQCLSYFTLLCDTVLCSFFSHRRGYGSVDDTPSLPRRFSLWSGCIPSHDSVNAERVASAQFIFSIQRKSGRERKRGDMDEIMNKVGTYWLGRGPTRRSRRTVTTSRYVRSPMFFHLITASCVCFLLGIKSGWVS